MQAAIQAASRQLPVNMPSPPTLRKVNPADAPILFLAMQSDSMPLYELDKYAENLLARQLSTLSGVAQVNVQGSQIFAVRLQVDPTQLAARNIGIDQVASAAQAANVNVATGTLNGPSQATLVHVNGQLDGRGGLEKADHRLAQRRAGALRGCRHRHRQRGEQPHRHLAQRQARHRAVDPAPARLQHHPDHRRDQRIIPHFTQSLPSSVKLSTIYDRSQSIRSSFPTCR